MQSKKIGYVRGKIVADDVSHVTHFVLINIFSSVNAKKRDAFGILLSCRKYLKFLRENFAGN